MHRRIGFALAILVGVGLLAASCSVDASTDTSTTATSDAASPFQGRLLGEPATVAARFSGTTRGLSPDGELMFLEVDNDTPSGSELCVVETENARPSFCIQDRLVLSAVSEAHWAGDSSAAVFGNQFNPDIMVVDMVTGVVDNVTDDGVLENLPESFNGGPRDFLPAFSPSGNRVVFYRISTSDELSLELYDRSVGEVVTRVDLSSGQRAGGPAAGARPRMLPFMVDESRALVSGVDHVLEVDFDAGEISEVFDFTDTFAPAYDHVGIEGRRGLQPIALLSNRRVLVSDADVWDAFNQSGGGRGYTSGAYVADLDEGSLVPLFADGTGSGAEGTEWFGPFAVLRAGPSQFILAWFDGSEIDERASTLHRLALIDLDRDDLPVVPSELPQLWDASRPEAMFALSHFPGWQQQVSAQGTIAITVIGDDGFETLLLELATD